MSARAVKARDTRTAEPSSARTQGQSQTSKRQQRRGSLAVRRVMLVASFIGSFFLAYVVVVTAGTLLPRYSGEVSKVASSDGEGDSAQVALPGVGRADGQPLSDAVSITSGGWAVRVAHQEDLNPHLDKSFLLTVWLKLSQPLPEGKRAIVVAKFGGRTPQRPGYALALSSGPDGVRPQVYWQDEGGRGRWLTFAAMNMVPGEWMVLGLSFRDGRYVGLHSRPLLESGRVEVLGGYDMQGISAPRTKSDLLLGSFSTTQFLGSIGRVGVFQGSDLSENIPKILTEMAADPSSVPRLIDRSDVVLWGSPKVDSGPRNLSVTLQQKGATATLTDDPA
jgi:hypothetical protein